MILLKQRAGDLTISRQLGNGVTSESAYDAAGRRIADGCSLANGQKFVWQQLWDAADNRVLSIEENQGILNGLWHDYDSTNRLIASLPLLAPQTGPRARWLRHLRRSRWQRSSVKRALTIYVAGYGPNPPAQPQIGYDEAGNRVNELTRAGDVVYSPNVRNEYVKVGLASLAYDRAGRLVRDTKFAYSYNFRGQLVQAAKSRGQIVLQIYHDALGRPVGVINGPDTRVLVPDGANPIEFYDNGVLSAVHLWEDQDLLCFFAAGGRDQYVLRDVLNSIRLSLDSQGVVAGVFRYDPFGNLIAGNPSGPFLYSGKYLYGAIGWYEYRRRQYLPNLGRFAQSDPAGFTDGANLYTFVGNNPLSSADPRGTDRQNVARGAVPDSSDQSGYVTVRIDDRYRGSHIARYPLAPGDKLEDWDYSKRGPLAPRYYDHVPTYTVIGWGGELSPHLWWKRKIP